MCVSVIVNVCARACINVHMCINVCACVVTRGAVEVVVYEDRAEVGGGRLRRGGRVGRGGHRGRGLRLRLRDAAERDLVGGLPLQGNGVALQGARRGGAHRPDPWRLQVVQGLPGLGGRTDGRTEKDTLFQYHWELHHNGSLQPSWSQQRLRNS